MSPPTSQRSGTQAETEQLGILQDGLERILAGYLRAREQGQFGKAHELWTVFESLRRALETRQTVREHETLEVDWSMGQGNWARIPWIAFLDTRETHTTQDGVYCIFLFRQDMSGVYLTYNQGVTALIRKHGTPKAREVLRLQVNELRKRSTSLTQHGFSLDDAIDLRTDSSLGTNYEHSTIAYKLYEARAVPSDREIMADLAALLETYDDHMTEKHDGTTAKDSTILDGGVADTFRLDDGVKDLCAYIAQRGFTFEPWEIAAYVTALRTKPFVILAGVSGTGKSKLPQLVAEATGGIAELVPVRPNWTDSSDVLGYEDLQGIFRPGPLIRLAQTAEAAPETHHVCVVDEMNLARVEYYFAEVLSRMEDRERWECGGYGSGPLLSLDLRDGNRDWGKQRLPPNLAIVGTVNMDETTHSFSRKVLDRAFTLEFSDIDLAVWSSSKSQNTIEQTAWPIDAWYPRAIRVSDLDAPSDEERATVDRVIEVLGQVNVALVQAQLQVGYRTRDEAALFALHANELSPSFVTRDGRKVDPLDLVLQMKVLPRIVGGSNAIRRLLLQLLGWAKSGSYFRDEEQTNLVLDEWDREGRPSMLSEARYPRTAARLCLMWDRLRSEGFTSFWL